MPTLKMILKDEVEYDVHLSRLDKGMFEVLSSIDDHLYSARFSFRNAHSAFFGEGAVPDHVPHGTYEAVFVNYGHEARIGISATDSNDPAEILTVRDIIAQYTDADMQMYDSKPKIRDGKFHCELSLGRNKISHQKLEEYAGMLEMTFKDFSFVDMEYRDVPGKVIKDSNLPARYIKVSPLIETGGW